MKSRSDQTTILLFENEALFSMSLGKDLENCGYTVIRANSGERAVETAGKTPGIDLILMDIEPGDGMDGALAAEQILEKHALPLVFILSNPDTETLEKVESIPSYGFVTRNSTMAEVNSSIWMALRFFEANENTKIELAERKRAEKELKKQLSEKEIILKEVNHRIKNNFATVEGLLQLQTQSIDNPETQSALQDAIAGVQSMRVLYDQLLISEDQDELSVKDYVENLADSVVASFPDTDRITMDKHITDFHLASNRLFHIGIIINELLTNAMKYAFEGKDTGRLAISIGKVNGHVTLTVQDNGNGLPDGFDAAASQRFGLMLVTMISEQLGGSFTMKDDNGTRCIVEFDV